MGYFFWAPSLMMLERAVDFRLGLKSWLGGRKASGALTAARASSSTKELSLKGTMSRFAKEPGAWIRERA